MASNGKNGKNGRLKRRLIWTGILAILLAGAFFGVKAAFKPDYSIDPSKLADVTQGNIARSVVATGKIEALTKVEVKSKASGIVQKSLNVSSAIWVKQGQVLGNSIRTNSRRGARGYRGLAAAKAVCRRAAWPLTSATRSRRRARTSPFSSGSRSGARSTFDGEGLIARSQTLEDSQKTYEPRPQPADGRRTAQRRDFPRPRSPAPAHRWPRPAAACRTRRWRSPQFHHPQPHRWSRALAGCRDRRRRQAPFWSSVRSATLVVTLATHGDVYVHGKVDEADIGRVSSISPRASPSSPSRTRSSRARSPRSLPLGVEKENVTTFEVRVSIINPDGEAQSQHDRQRGDRSGRAAERAPGS